MKVVIPFLSKKETDADFLAQATRQAKEVILVLPIDSQNISLGFAASDILTGEELMEDAKKKIGFMRKKCDAVIEWGDTFHRIDHLAKLRNAERIILVQQDNKAFRDLLEKLKNQKEYQTLAFKVEEEPEKP
jgi:hypothetical protein